ncbi:MAG: DNA methyltransferase [Cyanobacteria bacterium J06621_11]
MSFKNRKLSESLADSLVNIHEKTRSNLFTWRGQFSPQLIEQMLTNYASENSVVFDPFLGSGTVLFECALLGLESSGCEINPAAISFAKIYELINQPKNAVSESLTIVEEWILQHTNDLPLFKSVECDKRFEDALVTAYEREKNAITRTIYLAFITGMDFGAKQPTVKRINSVWKVLKTNIENLPHSKSTLKCFQRDSRKTALMGNSVDFIITSPPYINVFNYHQNYRKSIEKIGVDVLSVAKSEIGANRKFRQNRFLTVVQYCMDMSQVFCELRRICKKNAKVIFIVGRESNVRKTPFKNAELIAAVAEICGFNLIGEQTRLFQNKFGESIYEEILRFNLLGEKRDSLLEASREIGRTALSESLSYCVADVKPEIEDALNKSRKIETSPILEPQE